MAHTPTNIHDSPWSSEPSDPLDASPSNSASLTERGSTISSVSVNSQMEAVSESAHTFAANLTSQMSTIVTPGSMNHPPPIGQEDISVVMSQVLHSMDRVVEHLRSKGELDAANMIARNMIDIIKIFNDTTAPWDIETSLMPAVTPTAYEINNPSEGTQPTSTGLSISTNNPSSWAAIAAVAPAEINSIVKSSPQDAVRMPAIIARAKIDNIDPDKRVLWIRGWIENRPLGDVTKQIGQGPIYSMTYSPKDGSVCVIFQYAKSAKALLEDDDSHTKSKGKSRFGDGCDLMMGLGFPDNDDIHRMATPHNERRRLTFARQQLFTHGMTEAKFKADIYSIVGPSNVELVWLFNSGNATVVFSAVPLARMVRDEFLKYSRQPNSPYRDVHITFSHDPCERPMSLIKQLPAGRDFREGTYGGESALPAGIITKSASINRRNARDSEGWQTVGRRR